MTVMNPPVAVQASGATNNADDLRAALMAGMLGLGPGQNPRPRQGIIPGYGKELSVAASGTPAMNVVVGSGALVVPAGQNGHGGWFVINDGDLTLTIAASSATNPRTDLVIGRVADPQYTASGDGLAAIKVVTGTAGAGAPVPTVPSTDGPYQVLGQVAVAANAATVTNANITLNTSASRPFTVAAGGVLPVANAAARTALTPYLGQHVIEADTKREYVWDGTSWRWEPTATEVPLLGAAGFSGRSGGTPGWSMQIGTAVISTNNYVAAVGYAASFPTTTAVVLAIAGDATGPGVVSGILTQGPVGFSVLTTLVSGGIRINYIAIGY